MKGVLSFSYSQEQWGGLHGPHNVVSGDIKDKSVYLKPALRYTHAVRALTHKHYQNLVALICFLPSLPLLLPNHVEQECHVCLLFIDMQLWWRIWLVLFCTVLMGDLTAKRRIWYKQHPNTCAHPLIVCFWSCCTEPTCCTQTHTHIHTALSNSRGISLFALLTVSDVLNPLPE